MAKYTVVGSHTVLGHEPGETFDADLDNADYYLTAGHLARGKGEGPDKFVCPQCQATTAPQRPPKFDTHEELVAHYEDKHAGLVAPGKEE